ncbi:prolyl endopeptidase-like isoform X2 [Silurus meridionalis]|uniref:prolyl endopeptidase-like isoform X2 n=1 Tax=Silurus meridionalis TaxID=175797 RepID=UPI001EEB732B|nr:prolyl endopeptidase-like isoform X2 [Silurus meridionalis]
MRSFTSIGYMFLRAVTRKINVSFCKRQCVRMTARVYSGEAVKADLRNLKRLQRHFEKKLRSVYEQFADVPDSTVGLHHVYFVEEHVVYRAAREEDETHAVPVLGTHLGRDVDGFVQRVRLSPSESMLAATLKSSHSEVARCVLVRLEPYTVPQEPVLILENVFSFEWATDDVLYYTTQEGLQCRHVYRLHLTATGAKSTLVYEEKDPEFFVEIIQSRDQRLITVNCSSKSSSEVWMIDSKSPLSPPKLIQSRQPGLLYHVEHSDNQLYVLTNTGPGHEYELLRTPLSSPAMSYWEPVFSPGAGAVIKEMEMLPDYCVFTLRGPQGRLQVQTFPLKSPNDVTIHHLPSWACAVETERSDPLKRNSCHFLLSSPVHPPVSCCFSPTDERPLSYEGLLQHAALSECHTTRLQAISQDGTAVPLTLFHTKPLADLSDVPLLLHVYGAYGVDLNMAFSPEKRLLLEDNWALAYCHVRGGGECGLGWHRAGCLQQKKNGVEDLTACIQTLFQSGVSQPALTALTARSAGAVLAGALSNWHPHLLRAVLLQAPFLDVLDTMKDSSLPLTVEERGEWGDPLAYTSDWDNIASYCPCHNITPQFYPSMLITAYSEDNRVPLAGVLKYVEKLKRAIQTHISKLSVKGHVPAVILDLQPGGDHFGPEDYDQSMCEVQYSLISSLPNARSVILSFPFLLQIIDLRVVFALFLII